MQYGFLSPFLQPQVQFTTNEPQSYVFGSRNHPLHINSQDELDAIDVYQQNRLYHFSIYKISRLDRICAMIESLWDNLSFFKLIYGQKLLEGRESRERMIEEHQSYLDALKQRDSERISHLLAQNLKKRTEDIPYSLDVYFHENA